MEGELRDGLEFWGLERKLCLAVGCGETLERREVERAVALKSFDYRVLNLLLYEMEGQAVNEQHFEFLKASELLVEISDDLFDYEDDVLSNTFNVYRMFLAMYGPTQGQLELAHWISDIERRYEQLLSGLEASLSKNYRERCKNAAKEGGSTADSNSPMGSWTLPPPISNEGAYREEMREG
ncbi:hypothetical protein KFL_000630150 [Klebsormidium nitens]|uniref:Uncharacterized protein n=1 Tax=Klebsormidium nitens TaxID=105231 RepID=A0A1Y1HSM0_KLENI|nr:hypothetical protein KFL_000630150 [Klebsormidium nitens]|eukprot:GAQ80812.1 hypothetical protein KFL_000630150 [Klebsormidium nitens]